MSSIDWASVYAEHYDRVFRVVYRRVSANRPLAEDLTQDTFTRAIRAQRQWTDDGRGIGPWLTVIACNLCTDHFKSSRMRREVPVADMRDHDRTIGSAEDAVMTALKAGEVRQAMAMLTSGQRQALFLHYWAGWPDQRIAAEMGCLVGATKTLKYRGRQNLAVQLAPAA
ncbi:RNA polymerase sigma-70 factor (ECF subfamily) [Streptacidiphilus sp. MAP12-20]|uniref:RNA polymerase sigma factor n=1 Tax=Streptacidiphilus sp. MAP12-20 TaxID=3156299 RepID=UPI00351460E2